MPSRRSGGLLTVFIILGEILSGVFTPTESAAVACIYSFLVTMFIYRDYRWSELPLLVGRVVRTVGMVMIMIGFSVAFGYMMAIMQVPAKTAQFFLSIASDKYTLLLLINILLLALGTFMDLAPMSSSARRSSCRSSSSSASIPSISGSS